MKLIIDQSLDHEDVEITIKCRLIDADLEKLIAQIRLYGFAITGKKDGAVHPLRPEDIFYFESIDDKTFAYCEKDVFDCSLKLYELEQQLAKADFVRISKSCILNIAKLSSVKALINGRFEARLQNGEKLIINRHYVQGFKEKFNF
ncbi:LytTR family transcriptional regulator [Paenibacillus timonensis]|uniref:LytTR family DNA-binding domain-containing protein n=1 Tax=Paenibacillus timonensis TaxID=225915 RepID=A0ABW3S7S6_9BACL|nr:MULTISPECIES: LytTR family DNA-binding domain-containing protein [Paenibacillus]MCH1638651.1 LytTR family transcriptional regulator [Paenibacillus timonensis]MDU2241579.1 LytTR family DNA-binding domain-containing protein [Paenibacillus sp.]